jgi:MFS family permease
VEYYSIVAAACLLYAVSAGLRSVYGILLSTISAETGIAYASVSFALAVAQLAYGAAQPVFGVVALRKSSSFVLASGCILMASGLVMIPFCSAIWMLMLFLGILLPVGTGAVSFGIIMGTLTPKLGEKRAASVSGFVNASSGLGNIVFSPMIQSLFSSVGFKTTMFALSVLAVVLVPMSLWVGETKKEGRRALGEETEEGGVVVLLKKAARSKNYRFLMLGFFGCGFQMAIIETHLFSQILSYGVTDSLAAIAFSVYGVASVAGSLFSGFFSGRYKMKVVVGSLYGSRTLIVLTFLLLPKTFPLILAIAVFLGLTGAATVVPTSGLVGKLFGSKNLGTLFGLVFLCHQLGSFFSAWLGGVCVAATGGYTLIWCVSAALSVLASVVSFCIDEPEPIK